MLINTYRCILKRQFYICNENQARYLIESVFYRKMSLLLIINRPNHLTNMHTLNCNRYTHTNISVEDDHLSDDLLLHQNLPWKCLGELQNTTFESKYVYDRANDKGFPQKYCTHTSHNCSETK